MLVVIGDLVADLIVLGGGRLQRGTDNRAEVRLTRGGSAANVAAAVAPRHPVRFIGRVGDDTLGETLVRGLEADGVDVRVQRAGRTGSIVILVDDEGERTMITDRGAAAELEPVDPGWLDGATWLHVPLYGFVPDASRTALLDACRRVSERGVPISVDLSSTAAMREIGAAELARLLEVISPDVVFANADEADLAAEKGLAVSSVYIVKRGGESVLMTSRGVTTEVAVAPVDDVVDSTGAGDAFAAGYLAAALFGALPAVAAEAGVTLAAGALRRPGAL
jgi:sugar/nucleoside kinase (ribokinase family)